MNRLPVSIQTLYADLVDKSWSGSYQSLIESGGTPYKQTIKGTDFWYLKAGMVNGYRRKDRYLGPDGPEIRKWITEHENLRDVRKTRIDMVRSLRNARIPAPDPVSGKVLSTLSEAGAFRMRGVVVGSVAFQTYAPMLGVRFEDATGQTGDLDLAQFHSISLAVDDSLQEDFLTTLKSVDPRFEAVPSPKDGRRTLKYAIRVGREIEFSVDLLCPLRGPERERVTPLKAMRGDAQLLRYLDFLIYQETNAVSLYGLGVPVKVPAPERYAVHKLIVSQMRIDTEDSQAKARKDLRQASALLEVLLEDRMYELQEVWNEALSRGPSWQKKLLRGAGGLPSPIKEGLLRLTEINVVNPLKNQEQPDLSGDPDKTR